MKGKVRKPPLTLVPREALEAIAEGLEDGHIRCGHEPNDWRLAGKDPQVWMDAALRHVVADLCGNEVYDPDSGIAHLAKAMSNLAIVLTLRGYKYGKRYGDDVIPTGSSEST